ncbi:hypothetical protein SLA2020_416850 [Shorea laevis]
MLSKCDTEEFELFVGIARRIWFRRNFVVHGGEFIHPNSFLQGAIESDAEFRRQIVQTRALPWMKGKYIMLGGFPTGRQV